MAPDGMRYERLGYLAVNVSDLETSRAFYRDIVGLTLVDNGSADHAFFRCSDSHHDIMLTRGENPGLKRIGWRMESDAAFVAARDHMRSLGLPIVDVPQAETAELHIGKAFRTVEPSMGATFEFFVGMDSADEGFQPTHTKIARLGHLVMNSPQREASNRFMLDEMNFRASDHIEGMVTFMRCFPNRFHHSFGVGGSQSGEARLHHINFMVSEIDDIGKALNRLKTNNVPIVFGPGRHPPSDSVFLYFLDPDGITLEYSYGMEEFDEVDYREPRTLPPKIESIDVWGGAPQPGMGAVGAVERLELVDAR